MSSTKAIKYGVALSYFVIIFNIVAGLIYTPWMIDRIGRADYGLYVLVTSFLAYFTVDYGLWQAVNKLVAEHHVNGDEEKEHHVINVATSIYLLIDLCVAIVLVWMFFYVDDIYSSLNDGEMAMFKKLFVIASGFALVSFPFIFLKGVFMGREFFVPAKMFDIAKRVGVIVVTVALLMLDCGVISLVIAFGIVPFIICAGEYVYLWRKGYRIHPVRIDKATGRALLGLSIWLFLIVLGEMFVTNISPSVLARYADTTQIAIFAIGLTLYNYVYSFAGAINGFFLPRIYELRKDNNNAAIMRTSTMASALQMFVVGLFVMGIVCLGREFIYLWVGEDFHSSYTVACFVLLPVMITFCQPIESTELFATNRLHYKAILMILSAISTVVISICLCPQLGAVGAAIGIGVSMLVFMGIGLNIVFAIVLHRSRIPFIVQILRYGTAFALTYFLFSAFESTVKLDTSWLSLITKGMTFCFIYFCTAYLIALPKDVKSRILKPLLSRIKIIRNH